jgi:hypothetical protein
MSFKLFNYEIEKIIQAFVIYLFKKYLILKDYIRKRLVYIENVI